MVVSCPNSMRCVVIEPDGVSILRLSVRIHRPMCEISMIFFNGLTQGLMAVQFWYSRYMLVPRSSALILRSSHWRLFTSSAGHFCRRIGSAGCPSHAGRCPRACDQELAPCLAVILPVSNLSPRCISRYFGFWESSGTSRVWPFYWHILLGLAYCLDELEASIGSCYQSLRGFWEPHSGVDT